MLDHVLLKLFSDKTLLTLQDWHSEERKHTSTLTFDLLTSVVTKAVDAETETKTEAAGFETEAKTETVASETEAKTEAVYLKKDRGRGTRQLAYIINSAVFGDGSSPKILRGIASPPSSFIILSPFSET